VLAIIAPDPETDTVTAYVIDSPAFKSPVHWKLFAFCFEQFFTFEMATPLLLEILVTSEVKVVCPLFVTLTLYLVLELSLIEMETDGETDPVVEVFDVVVVVLLVVVLLVVAGAVVAGAVVAGAVVAGAVVAGAVVAGAVVAGAVVAGAVVAGAVVAGAVVAGAFIAMIEIGSRFAQPKAPASTERLTHLRTPTPCKVRFGSV